MWTKLKGKFRRDTAIEGEHECAWAAKAYIEPWASQAHTQLWASVFFHITKIMQLCCSGIFGPTKEKYMIVSRKQVGVEDVTNRSWDPGGIVVMRKAWVKEKIGKVGRGVVTPKRRCTNLTREGAGGTTTG